MTRADQKSNFISGDGRYLTANPECRFSTKTVFVQRRKPSIRTVLAVLAILGGQASSVCGGGIERAPAPGLAKDGSGEPHHHARCGLYSVCNLATHFCDTVVNECISCRDDCHPGRITGDRHATEECQEKCKVYYEVQRERERQILKETNDQKSKILLEDFKKQHSHRIHDAEIDEISKSFRRLETLKEIEVVCIAAVTALLFFMSVILTVLLHRRGALSSSERPMSSVYTSLENDSKWPRDEGKKREFDC